MLLLAMLVYWLQAYSATVSNAGLLAAGLVLLLAMLVYWLQAYSATVSNAGLLAAGL